MINVIKMLLKFLILLQEEGYNKEEVIMVKVEVIVDKVEVNLNKKIQI